VKAALGAKLKGSVAGGANAEIVKDATIVMVTVPFPGQAETYKAIESSLAPNTTVIDCTVPLASEVGSRDVSLASGFHTIMRHQRPLQAPPGRRPAGDRPALEVS
jgi:predicted dinucleotide-binding enzyme